MPVGLLYKFRVLAQEKKEWSLKGILFNFSAARKAENVAVVAPTSSPDRPTNVSQHSENTYANEDPGR